MKSEWHNFTKKNCATLVKTRVHETKLGEELQLIEEAESTVSFLKRIQSKYVIIGVEESIGPRANYGKPGAENAWKAFLSSFLNIQSNRYFRPDSIVVLGAFSFYNNDDHIDTLRENVAQIDYQLINLLTEVFECDKIPILIGGGHNNAYPLIKAYYQAKKEALSILNIDPHADFRPMEGRHSGNSFSYAMEEGFIDKYLIFGLHESYNSENMLKRMEASGKISWVSYENLLQNLNPYEDFLRYISIVEKSKLGFEIDMDAVADFPVSAFTPTGFTLDELRKLVIQAGKVLNVRYLNITESAPVEGFEYLKVGKAISCLVTDFIKNNT